MIPILSVLEEIYHFSTSFYTSTILMKKYPRGVVQSVNFCLAKEGVVERTSQRGYIVINAGKLQKFINNIPLFMTLMQKHYIRRGYDNKKGKRKIIREIVSE